MEASKNFKESTKNESNIVYESDEASNTVDLSDNEEDIFKNFNIEAHEPIENVRNQDNSSMFFNKYCEDTNIPSVANRLASVVVDYESNRKILINEVEDFDIEDEIEKNKFDYKEGDIYYSSEEEEGVDDTGPAEQNVKQHKFKQSKVDESEGKSKADIELEMEDVMELESEDEIDLDRKSVV